MYIFFSLRRALFGVPLETTWLIVISTVFVTSSMSADIIGSNGKYSVLFVCIFKYKIKSVFFSVWWFLVVAVAFGSCAFFIVNIYQQWQENPVMLVVSSGKARRWDIPFPAITVCPGKSNQLRPESGSTFDYERVSRCVVQEEFEQTENVTLLDEFRSCLNVSTNDRMMFDAAAMVCFEYNEELHAKSPDVAAAKDAVDIIRKECVVDLFISIPIMNSLKYVL